MRYVITYDIEEDPIRTRVAKLLESFGWRVQKSVFECPLEDRELKRLVKGLQKEIAKSANGNVRIYRLCLDCYRKATGIGDLSYPPDYEPWVVV